MSEFICVEVQYDACVGISRCGQCVKVCPVNIFENGKDKPRILEQNQDECTLCNLCLEECKPAAILIRKLYEESSTKLQ
jgi:NAD-dependent dihydropyrimidine dehydrogenase PreA subunit